MMTLKQEDPLAKIKKHTNNGKKETRKPISIGT